MSIQYQESVEVSSLGFKRTRSLKVGRIVVVAVVVMAIAIGCILNPRIKNFLVIGGGIETKAEFDSPPEVAKP